MVEFTEREKTVIHLMNMLMNPLIKDIPMELRVQALAATCLVRNIPYDKETMEDMSLGIKTEIELAIKEGYGFLNKHPDLLKHIKDFKI